MSETHRWQYRMLLRSTGGRRIGSVMFCLLPLCAGCLWPRFYVDPQQTSARTPNIQSTGEPCKVAIDFKNRKNGLPMPWGYGFAIRRTALKTIESSGVFVRAEDENDPLAGHLLVTLDHVYGPKDVAKNAAFSIITGYTWGLIGSSVTEKYEITLVYTPPAGEPVAKTFDRAIYVAIGLGSTPEDKERLSFFEA